MQCASVALLLVWLWLSAGTPAALWAHPWNGTVVRQAFWWDCWHTHYPQDWDIYLAKLAPPLGDKDQKGTVATRSGNQDSLWRLIAVAHANGLEGGWWERVAANSNRRGWFYATSLAEDAKLHTYSGSGAE